MRRVTNWTSSFHSLDGSLVKLLLWAPMQSLKSSTASNTKMVTLKIRLRPKLTRFPEENTTVKVGSVGFQFVKQFKYIWKNDTVVKELANDKQLCRFDDNDVATYSQAQIKKLVKTQNKGTFS